jgi:hypothetical protein
VLAFPLTLIRFVFGVALLSDSDQISSDEFTRKLEAYTANGSRWW